MEEKRNTQNDPLIPTEEDFKKVVGDYLSWKVSQILRDEMGKEREKNEGRNRRKRS